MSGKTAVKNLQLLKVNKCCVWEEYLFRRWLSKYWKEKYLKTKSHFLKYNQKSLEFICAFNTKTNCISAHSPKINEHLGSNIFSYLKRKVLCYLKPTWSLILREKCYNPREYSETANVSQKLRWSPKTGMNLCLVFWCRGFFLVHFSGSKIIF